MEEISALTRVLQHYSQQPEYREILCPAVVVYMDREDVGVCVYVSDVIPMIYMLSTHICA